MKKTRRIRTQHTLLALTGGFLLGFLVFFAYYNNHVLISTTALIWAAVGYWLVNGLFVAAVVSGFSERFRDPSMSMAQMLWAVSICMITMLIMPRFAFLIYFLLFLISIFGVFRLKPIAFVIYAVTQASWLAAMMLTQYKLRLTDFTGVEFLVSWFVFVVCLFILTMLCYSMAALRAKLRQRNAELQDAVAARSQFLANMSHEIRTPMNGIIGMLDLLEKEELNKTQQRYLTVARSSGHSLVALINDILDFSKIEAGMLELDLKPLNIKNLVFAQCQSFYFMAWQKQLTFVMDIDPKLPDALMLDELRLRQVFNNVLGNALKFTQQGSVELHIKELSRQYNESLIEIRVKDSGIGISESAKAKIFESFAQADNSTTRRFGGSGLGLAICKHLCEAMNGSVSVESELDKGSVFILTLRAQIADAYVRVPGSLAKCKVLVFDRSRVRADILARDIAFLDGQTAICIDYSSPETVLEQVLEFKPELVVFYAKGLSSDDEQLMLELRRLPAFRRVQFILCRETLPDDALFAECALLQEPYSIRSLYEVMNASLNKTINDVDEPVSANSDTSDGRYEWSGNMQKVLLVEDNLTNQEVAMMLLEDCEVEVHVASDGQQALDKLSDASQSYGLVFMDCQMPVLDGFSTTEAIRAGKAGEHCKNIAIIAMTANALVGDKERCLASGMSDYISKPISFDEVENKLEQWMNRPAT